MGLVGEKVLLYTCHRMSRVTALLVIFAAIVLYPHVGITGNYKKDIISTHKSKDPVIKGDIVKGSGDILTNNTGSAQHITQSPKTPSYQASINRDRTSKKEASGNFLYVYMGKCSYTRDAIQSVKDFLKDKDFEVTYYAMKTTLDTDLDDVSFMKGVSEVYLPLDAEKYDIDTLPTFIMSVRGTAYKLSGVTDLEEAYKEITKGAVNGTNRGEYIDIGKQGSGCQAVKVNLSPAPLSPSQIRQVNAEYKKPYNIQGLLAKQRFNLQEREEPVHIRKKINIPGYNRYIVFSQNQLEWALGEIKKGGVGCCTNCLDTTSLWPFVQMCSKDMIKKLGITSTPTVVDIL